jgi:hypothetical protein
VLRVEGAQDNTVAIVAIAVTGGVSLAVALIAAIFAHYRQKADFGHERKMRTREDGTAALDTAIMESYAWMRRLVALETRWREGKPLTGTESEVIVREANEGNMAVGAAGARLEMRFGQDSAIATTYEALWDTMATYAESLKPYTEDAAWTDHGREVHKREEEADAALAEFVRAAKAWLDTA